MYSDAALTFCSNGVVQPRGRRERVMGWIEREECVSLEGRGELRGALLE